MLLDTATGKTQTTHGASCSCPACLGLQCLERPRYFSGQLLTETDLNSEQEYMLAKQRLHNRYLHGSGIVCGLQVSCSACAGAVTIQSGYAIDPCGNDIIVCNTQDFNVVKRIHDCEKERKRQRKSNCDPIQPPQDVNCKDLERHYCLTIAYNEQETRLTPTLRQGSATNTGNGQGNACACNGSGKKNGCGCNSSSSSNGSQYANSQTMSSTSMSSSSASSQSSSATSCQPTRILEGYQIDICEVPPDYCGDAKAVLEDTLLAKIIDCFTSLKGFFDRKLPRNVYNVLTPLAFTGNIDTTVSLDDLYRSCCYLRQTIHDLYGCDPLNTHCQTLDVLTQVCCQSPPSGEATEEVRASYVEQTRTTLYDLLALLMQYTLDCVCQALLPCCSPAPADDRLILACMTVMNDQIIDICNFCHRRYAGSFPALYYWLSLVPVIPLIAYAVEHLCCYDWLKREFTDRQGNQQSSVFHGNLVNGLTSLLNSMDPSGSLSKEIFADNFAMPRSYATKFDQLINKVSSPAKVAEMLQPQAFNLTKVIDKSIAEATTALQEASVTPVVHTVASIDEVPILRHLATSPFAMAGDHVVLYSANDKVVGYATLTSLPDIDQVKHDVASLKDNMTQLPQAAEVGEIKNNLEALRNDLSQVPQAADVNQIKDSVEAVRGDLANVPQAADVNQIRTDVETLKNDLANVPQAAAIDEIKNNVDALRNDLANVPQSSTIDELKNDIEALRSNLANVPQPAEIGQIRSDLDALRNDLANAPQAADVNQIRSDVEALKNDLAKVPQATDVSQINSDVEKLKNDLANVPQSSTIDALKNDVEALKNDLANVPQATDVSQIKGDVEALKNDLANVPQAADVNQIGNEVETLKSDLANVPQVAEISQIKSDVEALRTDLANVAQAAEVSGIRDEVSGIKNEVEALRNDLANVAQPPAPSKEISDLQATIKALQDALATLRSEVDQLKSRDTGNTGDTGGTPPAEPPQV